MTIRELFKQYPNMETLALIDAGGSPFPSWSYSPDDDVIEWHIEKNKRKPKIEYKDILVFTWRRKEKTR